MSAPPRHAARLSLAAAALALPLALAGCGGGVDDGAVDTMEPEEQETYNSTLENEYENRSATEYRG